MGNRKNLTSPQAVKDGVSFTQDQLDAVLCLVASEGDCEAVERLLQTGSDIDCQKGQPLRHASANGHLGVVKFLVEAGADIHHFNDEAFRYACADGHLEIAEYLLANGAKIDAMNNYAVRWASEKGHLEVVKFLVERGADIHAHDNHAIDGADEYGHQEVVDFLIAKGDWQTKDEEGLSQLERLAQKEDCAPLVERIEKYLKAKEQAAEEMRRHNEVVAILKTQSKPFALKRRAK